MSKKKKRGDIRNKILSEDEVHVATKALHDFFSNEFPGSPWLELISAENIVRLMSLSHHVKEMRESRGLSIKEVALQFKVPQYRLKAIEEGSESQIKPDVFWKYIEFLDLTDFVKQWIAANKELAQKLGLLTEDQQS